MRTIQGWLLQLKQAPIHSLCMRANSVQLSGRMFCNLCSLYPFEKPLTVSRSNSSALRGWKGQQIDGKLHIQRAPRAGISLALFFERGLIVSSTGFERSEARV